MTDLIEILLQEKDDKPVILEAIVDGEKSHLKKDGIVKYEDGNTYCLMSTYDVLNKEEDGKMFVYLIDVENKKVSVVEDMELAKKVYCAFLYQAQQTFEYIPTVKK